MSQTIAERAVTNPASALTGSELVPVSQGGLGVVATMAQIAALFGLTAGIKVYRALLTQTGTDAPVATVLQNTLGAVPVWTRSNIGSYVLTLGGAFPPSKTFVLVSRLSSETLSLVGARWDSANTVVLTTSNLTADFPGEELLTTNADEILTGHSIEILVFP